MNIKKEAFVCHTKAKLVRRWLSIRCEKRRAWGTAMTHVMVAVNLVVEAVTSVVAAAVVALAK